MSVLIERLKVIRRCEGFTQSEFCEAIGLSLSTYKKYEAGYREEAGGHVLLKVAAHPAFSKYTLWLMTGAVDAADQQVAPV